MKVWHCVCGENFISQTDGALHQLARGPLGHWQVESDGRPDWPDYFMGVAEAVSKRASCPRASIGAVIVAPDHTIVSTGYNGAPPGEPHCLDDGCIIEDNHCQRSIHAEMNALVFARRPLQGCHIYVYGREVCRECAKVLRAAGVTW